MGRTRVRLISGAVLVAAFVGGFAVAAAAAVSYSSLNYFYAEWGVDGVIHCAAGHAGIDTNPPGAPGHIVRSLSTSYAKRDLYCVNDDSYPSGYLKARATLLNSGGIICGDSGWSANPTRTGRHINDSYWNLNSVDCAGFTRFRVLAEHNNAVNFGWRYGNEYSPMRTN